MSHDLIKRSDAIKATWQKPTYTDPLNILTEVRDRIEIIPSADRPQGRWIYDYYNSRGVNRCSECGAEIKGYGENIPFPNCPYCLARMKGANDE